MALLPAKPIYIAPLYPTAGHAPVVDSGQSSARPARHAAASRRVTAPRASTPACIVNIRGGRGGSRAKPKGGVLYPGEWVAMLHGRVLAHAPRRQDVALEAYEQPAQVPVEHATATRVEARTPAAPPVRNAFVPRRPVAPSAATAPQPTPPARKP